MCYRCVKGLMDRVLVFLVPLNSNEGFLGGSVVKNPPANAGDAGSIPGSGRSPGEGNSNPVQYSCLENSTNIEAWQATVHGVTRVRHDLATKLAQKVLVMEAVLASPSEFLSHRLGVTGILTPVWSSFSSSSNSFSSERSPCFP